MRLMLVTYLGEIGLVSSKQTKESFRSESDLFEGALPCLAVW
jgi:hypothetical protein